MNKSKEDKIETRSWKKGEILSTVSAALSFVAICISTCSLKQTIHAVTMTDSTFKTSQSNFKLENRPIIQINDINIDSSLLPNAGFTISFTLTNLGRFPGKINSLEWFPTFMTDSSENTLQNAFLNPLIKREINLIKANEKTLTRTENVPLNISITDFKNNSKNVYIIGRLIYENAVSLTPEKYDERFCFKIKWNYVIHKYEMWGIPLK